MKFFTKIAAGCLVALSPTLVSTNAMAATGPNTQPCTSTSYACQTYGYSGTDPYGYSNYSNHGANGTLHNCTSYAAYMVWLFSPLDNRWSTLGDASAWASRAAMYGLPVGTVPHAGDIAQWDFDHVAYVESVTKDSAGNVLTVEVTDDNYNALVTTHKFLHPGHSEIIAYPDHFITFPKQTSGGGGGGRPPVAMIATPGAGV